MFVFQFLIFHKHSPGRSAYAGLRRTHENHHKLISPVDRIGPLAKQNPLDKIPAAGASLDTLPSPFLSKLYQSSCSCCSDLGTMSRSLWDGCPLFVCNSGAFRGILVLLKLPLPQSNRPLCHLASSCPNRRFLLLVKIKHPTSSKIQS